MFGRLALALTVLVAGVGCAKSRSDSERETPSAALSQSARAFVVAEPLAILHLPDGGDALPPPVAGGLLPGAPSAGGRCPREMVDVRGEFCIDRFESSLVDAENGEALSPHYHPTRAQTAASWARYRDRGSGANDTVRAPPPPEFQLKRDPALLARSLESVVPQGYLSGELARIACHAAGKRLCSHAEWVLACRGQQNRKFPYGDSYQERTCNVFREAHPAQLLHRDASREHLDPRLGLVSGAEGPLLRRTGATSGCRSEWGSDAVFDMVGNLDEWLEDGGFAGGFFSRGTRDGCDARITSHPSQYFDYSLGARCCR